MPKYEELYRIVSGEEEEFWKEMERREMARPEGERRTRKQIEEDLNRLAGGQLTKKGKAGKKTIKLSERELKESIKADLINAKKTHSGTEWGRKGLKRVANMFERDIEKAYQEGQENRKRYDVVFMACDLL